MKRRLLLQSLPAAAFALHGPRTLLAADLDLLIRGGRLIDPAHGIDRRLDLGIRGGRVAEVHEAIDPTRATEVLDASGLLVVPGLIDVHVHARDAELPPPEFLATGVTTMVDAGSRGADNVDQLVDVARGSPNRMRILLNVAELGNNPGGRAEFLDGIATANVDKARAAVERHRDWIVGIKARLSRGVAADLDVEVLRRAIEVATPSGLPVMIHVGDTATPLPRLLTMLRPGDIVTHMYAPTPNGILDEAGRVILPVREARNRGIRFDFGNGLNEHWAWDVAEKAMAQEFPPDTISSDLNVPGRAAQVFDLPNVLSKFLVLGMPLPDVIARATANAAATFAQFRELGTLRVGATADVTLLEQAQGTAPFVDNYGGEREGSVRLATREVIVAGHRVNRANA